MFLITLIWQLNKYLLRSMALKNCDYLKCVFTWENISNIKTLQLERVSKQKNQLTSSWENKLLVWIGVSVNSSIFITLHTGNHGNKIYYCLFYLYMMYRIEKNIFVTGFLVFLTAIYFVQLDFALFL